MSALDWFAGRTAILATKHRKEQAIAPLVERQLGTSVIVPPNFDSDRFGTFTRDVARQGTQLEAARAKANAALDETGGDLAIASEGSFAPHPNAPFLPGNRELVLWLDRARGLEVVGCEVTPATNYAQTTVASVAEALDFATRVRFPEHALVVSPKAEAADSSVIQKGLRDRDALAAAVEQVCANSPTGSAFLETDMRAHCNPLRMQAIARATEDLVNKLRQSCPQCERPGFAIAERQPGLPCAWCGAPTPMTRLAIRACPACGYRQEILHPDGKTSADPTYCQQCNP